MCVSEECVCVWCLSDERDSERERKAEKSSPFSYSSGYATDNDWPLVDLELNIPYPGRDDETIYFDDELHFNAAGYDLFGELVFKAIREKLKNEMEKNSCEVRETES